MAGRPDNTSTLGASGVIFGWLVFLLVRGFFARSLRQIALAVVLFVIWGGVLLGRAAGRAGGLLAGRTCSAALAGLLARAAGRSVGRPAPTALAAARRS